MVITVSGMNVVVLGNQNPSIVSHKFLVDQGIVSSEVGTPQPFATPIFSQLSYENFSIQVDQNRLQVQQELQPGQKPFVNLIASKYYSILQFTPVNAYGVNFVGQIEWGSLESYKNFLAVNYSRCELLTKLTKDPDWRLGFTVMYRLAPFIVRITIDPSTDGGGSALSINCHRGLPSEDGIKLLVAELADTQTLAPSIIDTVNAIASES